MSRGKREEFSGKKLNMKKVTLIIVIILAIFAIILTIKNKERLFKESDKIAKQNETINDKIETENKEKTIEEILSEFGGETVEQPKSDTYIVKKDDKLYTVYSDGEIVEGKINIWSGESKEPAVDSAGNYNIYSAEELKWISDKVTNGEKNFNGVTITLRTNIDFGARQKEDGSWEGEKWTAIVGFLDELPKKDKNAVNTEKGKENLKRFAGCFDGNGFSIRGLYLNSDKKYQGLFGYSSGTIQNLTLKNSCIIGKEVVGGIVGLNGGTILNCSLKNSVINGDTKVGGICGMSMTDSTIKQCSTEKSKISAKDYTGGICGYINNNVTLTETSNDATVTGEDYVGGISGISFYGGSLNTNKNNGEITGEDYVGGISGYSQSEIEKCNNSGKIVGINHIAGIVGVNYTMGDISRTYNSGDILGRSNVGGIVGTNNGTVSNTYNKGKINATSYRAGGICGQNGTNSFIYTSYNIGNIEGKQEIDGVIGGNFGTITKCYYLDESVENGSKEQSKNEQEMKENIITDLGVEFVADSKNINDGYPIFSWQ